MISVLLVEDHSIVRYGLRHLLTSSQKIKVVAETDNGKVALSLYQETHPDVILLDINLPGLNGLEVAEKILKVDSKAKILILTGQEDAFYPWRFLENGVLGYIEKKEPIEVIIEAIKTVYQGKRYISEDIAKQIILKKTSNPEKSLNSLSNRELQVALLISKGQKTTNISQQLNLSPKTVSSYKHRIFQKLDIKTDAELTRVLIKYHLIDPNVL